MGVRPLEIFQFFECWERVYASESDVHIRQILTSKDGPRAERVKRVRINTIYTITLDGVIIC